MDGVTAFAPATVSNVACGFDVLGFALESPGDEVTARLITDHTVRIDEISGDNGRLPRDASKNTAGVAARALLDAIGERRGVALTIRKGLPLSSGLGGSAASAVAAVVAVDALLGARTAIDRLLACAFEGERTGAGSAHADNIAPSLYGGFVLVRVPNPPDIVRLPIPNGLTAVVVHPDLEIETARARALLGDTVPLGDAVRQWANLGAFVDALHRSDFDLMARSLEDTIAEPRRASLIPGLAPDGGLYVPETIEPWSESELARLPRRTLTEIALRVLRPFTRGELDPATLEAVVVEALNFPIPLVELEPGVFALELFHGPTLAFKDVGARVMARIMAAMHTA